MAATSEIVGSQPWGLVDISGREDVAGQIAHGETGAAAADCGRQDYTGVGIEGQICRGSPAS